MLSSPRKPPSKTLLPAASLRFTHQLKLSRSLWKTRSRKARSAFPVVRFSILYTRHAAQAWTGGVTTPKTHSQAGDWPLGGMYPPLRSTQSCFFGEPGAPNIGGKHGAG